MTSTTGQTTESDRETPEVLLGELAHQLAHLVRLELEAESATRMPTARQVAKTLAAVAAVGTAILLGVIGLSFGAYRAFDSFLPGWAAGLAVAGCWFGLAAALGAVAGAHRLMSRLDELSSPAYRAAIVAERQEADAAIRHTAALLVEASARSAVEGQVTAATSIAHQGVEAGKDMLGRLIGRSEDEPKQ